MSENKSEPKKGLGDRAANSVSLGKDLVALLRDSALFILALLLLFFPAAFNTILTKAGFEEGSLVGFKWKAKLIDADAALKEARVIIADLKSQLEKTSLALSEAQRSPNDPSVRERLVKLQEENKQLNATTTKVEASVATTIASSAQLVEKAQTNSGASQGWGVIFSGDSSLEDAKYEANVVAPKLGIPNVTIYFRDGSYRSVAVLEDRMQAEQVLPKAKQRRADAYIVNMSSWCVVTNPKEGYLECVGR
jgi:hypothetical protein